MGIVCSAVSGVADLAGGGEDGGCLAITFILCSLSMYVLGVYPSPGGGGLYLAAVSAGVGVGLCAVGV